MICVPINACDEVVVEGSAGYSVGALVFGFQQKDLLNLPPGLAHVNFIAEHEWRLHPRPSHQVVGLPSPLLEVCYGRCHGSTDGVPRVLLGMQLVKCGFPGLLKGCHLFSGPGLYEAMDCLDVVDDDLVCRINVFLLMEVISAVQQAAEWCPRCLAMACLKACR